MLSFSHLPFLVQFIPIIAASIIPTLQPINLTPPVPTKNPPTLLPPPNTTTPSHPPPTNLTSPITFTDVIYDGVRITRTQYNHAIFRAAHATSTIGPTTDPHFLTDMRLVFSITQGAYRSIYLDMSATWPQWGPPRLTTVLPPEDDGVLPSMFGMDIVDAVRKMKAAGFGQGFEAVDVRWPGEFPQEEQQALYLFQMVGGEVDFVAVGARDGRVTPIYYAGDKVETE